MRELAAADAHWFWLSSKLPNDQFLVFVFDGEPAPGALEQVRPGPRRAEFRLRVADDSRWRYPRRVPAAVTDEQFVVHDEPTVVLDSEGHDRGGLAAGDFRAIARLGPLDTTRMTWRLHVFPPGVVVVQMSHALGDGTRSSALAAILLGRGTPVAPAAATRRGNPLWRGAVAARKHRDAQKHRTSAHAAASAVGGADRRLGGEERLRDPCGTGPLAHPHRDRRRSVGHRRGARRLPRLTG